MINVLRDDYSSIIGLTPDEQTSIDYTGGIIVWDIPDFAGEKLRAYDPLVFVAHTYTFEQNNRGYIQISNTEYIYLNTDIKEVTLTLSVGGKTYNLKAETHNGEAQFNISPFIVPFFSKDLDNIEAYIIRVESPLLTTNYKYVWNGVTQIGASDELIGTTQTLAKYLTYYEGYPLSVVKGGVFTADVINYDPAWTKASSEMGIEVRRECVPPSPFYVRWVNALGGVDYWMFSRNQEYNPSVSNTDTYDIFTPDIAAAATNRRAYGIKTKSSITVGAEGVNEGWEVLRGLPFAPIIEWYNEAAQKWINITVAKYNGEIRPELHTHSIEITFDLPNINTQF